MIDKIDIYLTTLKEKINALDKEAVKQVVEVIFNAYKEDKQIFICGNGGSAATASHFACDLSKGTLKDASDYDEKRFKVVSLTDNLPLMSAIANDLSYEHIFAQQLINLMNKRDLLIAISVSGNSENVVKAAKVAKKFNGTIIAFTGKDGGKLKQLADYNIHIPDDHFGRVEDMHLILEHLICSCLSELKKKE